jgi:pimeloyl-ACP methyl ester carboxylesterase
MMMNRRTFASTLATGAVVATIPRVARGQALAKAENIVLVHGLFADGSCWSEVIPMLQAAGLNVTSVQNPLTTLDDAVAETQRVLNRQVGPTVLVGHSFSGMIVTEAGIDPNVSALVYVAARAPDAGEDYTALSKTYPTPPASAGVVFDGDEGRLTENAFLHDFAGDLPTVKARVLYAVRGVAFEAELLRRLGGRSHDRSRTRTIHGQAHGCHNNRAEVEPSVAHFASARDLRFDSPSRRARLEPGKAGSGRREWPVLRKCEASGNGGVRLTRSIHRGVAANW